MSDLIDLNSPDTSKVLKKELAAPLIPTPAGIEGDSISVTNTLPTLITDVKRDSLENNPFDKVLQETTEYVQKKGDPFEMVLEKVISRNEKSKRHSAQFNDDFIPKSTKHAEVLKLNRTIDSSMLDSDVIVSNPGLETNSINENLNNSALLQGNNVRNLPSIFIQPDSPLSSSILNYSAMNDSLTETNVSFKEPELRTFLAKKALMCAQKEKMQIEGNCNKQEASLISRRCHSQSDRLSPKTLNCKQRPRSLSDFLKKLTNNERSTLSSISSVEFDEMNKAFLQEPSNLDNSVFFDLSNISEITRLNSLSSAYNSSLSLTTNATLNQGFLGSSSSCQKLPIDSDPSNTLNNFRCNSTSSIGSTSASETVRNDISALRQKFQDLKTRLSHSSSNNSDECIKENSGNSTELKSNVIEDFCKMQIASMENKLEIDKKEEKLIDVEVFIPSDDSKSSYSKESFTDSSSDSVFTKSIADKSILIEAKKLAKTFEEMADDTSNSSGFDLLSNITKFNFDDLPHSDDETVDNLIDLPPSPVKPGVPPNSPTEIENEIDPNSEYNEIQKEISRIKEIEKEFTQPNDTEKKIIVTSLLLQVEQLIKNDNPDAKKLLNELEKVLGIKCENNTDLLKIYLESTKTSVQGDQDDTPEKEIKEISLENECVEYKDNNVNVEDKELKENSSDRVSGKEGLKRKSSYVIRKGKTDIIRSFSKSFDSSQKMKPSIKNSTSLDTSVSRISNISPSSKQQRKSQIVEVRKRFSSDPNDLNSSLNKKQTYSTLSSMKKSVSTAIIKEKHDKIVTVPAIQKGTFSSVSNAMRNKLKNKSETGVSKKGPMKATIPFINMQKRESIGRKVSSASEVETSLKASPRKPSSFNVPTSTPNASVSSLFKKKSKPVASSTPDSKNESIVAVKSKSPRTRKLLCNISPVSTLVRSSLEKWGSKGSPKENKVITSSPKRPSTPKPRKPPRSPSGIPKMSPNSFLQRRKSLNDLNKSGKYLESQFSGSSNLQKPLGSTEKVTSLLPKSPLRNRNKMDLKKPYNLTPKLQRRGDEYLEAEKENFS